MSVSWPLKGDPRIDWDTVRIFLAAARSGSLRAAADALSVNHATVNRGLRALEDNLGTRLFERSPSGLVLTQPGEEMIEMAEQMERQALTMARRISGLDARPSGAVRVSVPPILAYHLLAPIFADFSRAYPEIEIVLTISNRFFDLDRHETDVSIRVAHEVDESAFGRRLMRYSVCAYASPDYLTRHPDLTVGDGTGAHWIGWHEDDTKTWIRDSPFPNAEPLHIIREAVMHAHAARAGMGLTYMPCFIGDPDPGLVRVPGVTPEPNRSLWLLLHSDLRHTARVRALVDFVAAEIGKRKGLLVAK